VNELVVLPADGSEEPRVIVSGRDFYAAPRPSPDGTRLAWLAWIPLGSLTEFPEGRTRLASYENPFVRPWDGETGKIPCWVRRLQGESFQVFAINCTHLGCPVRWFEASGLFMCPCHGGVFYADGRRASGPPPRELYQYEYKIENGQLWIRAGQVPTLGQPEV